MKRQLPFPPTYNFPLQYHRNVLFLEHLVELGFGHVVGAKGPRVIGADDAHLLPSLLKGQVLPREEFGQP